MRENFENRISDVKPFLELTEQRHVNKNDSTVWNYDSSCLKNYDLIFFTELKKNFNQLNACCHNHSLAVL